jgi:two-component sensor histidine kinase
MTSLELITQTISTLGNCTLNKVETKELLNLLREIQEIPQLIEQIQLELTKRFDNGDVNSYIEL